MKIIDTSLTNSANALLNLIRKKNYLWALYIKYHKCKPVVKIKSLKNSMKYERKAKGPQITPSPSPKPNINGGSISTLSPYPKLDKETLKYKKGVIKLHSILSQILKCW